MHEVAASLQRQEFALGDAAHRRRREGRRRQLGDDRMVGENVGCVGAPGPAGLDHDAVERVHREPLPFVERS